MTRAAEEPGPGQAGRLHVTLGRAAGWHWATFDKEGRLVVEWYDHGADVPYESASQLAFEPARMAASLGTPPGDEAALLRTLASRFTSYWQVRDHADAHGLPYAKRVDFRP